MRSSTSSRSEDQNKSKDHDHQATLINSMKDIRRVVEANQLRLQHMELTIGNLTSICKGLRTDMSSQSGLALTTQGASKTDDVRPRRSRSSISSMEWKDDMLAVQMQQLVEQAAALGILKDVKTGGPSKLPGKADPKAPTGQAQKNVQATLKQKRSARALIQTTESTTEKKLSMKVATRVKCTGAMHSKGSSKTSAVNNNVKPTATAKLSMKSTVKRTTISQVYVEPADKGRNKATRVNVSVGPSVKNVETVKGKGTIKLAIKANSGKSDIKAKSNTLSKMNGLSALPSASMSDDTPRKKWSTTKEITTKK